MEATVPTGLNPTEFTVRVSVGADGTVQNVSNLYALPNSLFDAAADAARHWHFRSDRNGGDSSGFEAEITFHSPVAGTVTTQDGALVAGVVVSGSVWKACCPYQRDIMTTDKSGSFRIEHPGAVLHFLPDDRFQPRSIVVTSKMSTLNVALDPASNSLPLPPCGKLQPGIERIGWGQYGLQFDVPQHDARLFRGKVDTDYVVHIVKAKHSNDRVEFWFGPYAMDSTPDDEQFVESETFATRNVVKRPDPVGGSEGGVIGRDTWGRLPNDKSWRRMAIPGEGATYQDVNSENAALFDRIINSACWIEYPKR
ncbi:MAG: hypothetical protein WCA89_15300 [Terracidiphilus sp.]|jgi:hypothetical protein